MTFSEEIVKVRNKPITLIQMHPRERLIDGWTNSSGTIYYIQTSYFVIDVKENNASLTEAASVAVGSNEFFYDTSTSRVYVDVGEDPANTFLSVVYRLFYATKSIDLPYDLASGITVPYVGLIDSVSSFKDEINSDDLVGISLSGSGSVSFINDGTFNSIYGKLFWETTLVNIYMGFSDLAVSEYKLLYKGFVDSKTFSPLKITFKFKDFIEKLRADVPLDFFTSADGEITNEGDPKRRIYGRAKVLGIALDKIKDGFNLTGTFTKTAPTVITGSSSALLSEASPNDEIRYIDVFGEEQEYSIQSVDSNTQITLSEEIEDFDAAYTLTLIPRTEGVPYKNRELFICDHQMREPSTTVVSGLTLRAFTVASTDDFEAGDTITVDGQIATIANVSTNNTIFVVTDLLAVPSASDVVTKQAVHNVWFNKKKLLLGRDYTITNGDPSKIVLENDAEFNIEKQILVSDGASTAMTFTNGSRNVTGNIAFVDFFKPWDWVRSNDLAHTTWYQILEVQETKIILRTAYGGTNRTSNGFRKSVTLVNDDSKVLIDCNGITFNGVKTGTWVKTASNVVKHLLEEQSLELNAASFTQANLDANYLISMAIPLEGGTSRAKIRDVIDLINKTVLGSLYENADREICYTTLSPRKAVIDEIFVDHDAINYTIESSGKNIAKKVISKYQFSEASIFTGELENQIYEYTNPFVSNISDIEREELLDLYLFNEYDAQVVTQQISLLREAANTVVKMSSFTRFHGKSLNELVYLELRDMFQRFGTDADRNFIGIITMLNKRSDSSEVEIADIGAYYNKIATFADSTAVAFSLTDEVARAKNGFYTDDNGIIDSSRQYRLNLYG